MVAQCSEPEAHVKSVQRLSIVKMDFKAKVNFAREVGNRRKTLEARERPTATSFLRISTRLYPGGHPSRYNPVRPGLKPHFLCFVLIILMICCSSILVSSVFSVYASSRPFIHITWYVALVTLWQHFRVYWTPSFFLDSKVHVVTNFEFWAGRGVNKRKN